MDKLFIEKTKNTPEVLLDKDNNTFFIKGRSIHEDSAKFYAPIIEWFENYIKTPNQITKIEFFLEYYNSSSAKRIVRFLYELEQLLDKGYDVKVIWNYEKSDELMQERGEELEHTVRIPFEFNAF